MLDHRIGNFDFGLEYSEYFMLEKSFKISGFGRWADHESAIVVIAAVGGQNM